MSELTIISKLTERGTRYFTDPPNIKGFDGTAQGWGFKTRDGVHRAYVFWKNRDKIKADEAEAKKFLRENPDVRKMLDWYFAPDMVIDRLKDDESSSLAILIASHEDAFPVEIGKLKSVKHLHRAITRIA